MEENQPLPVNPVNGVSVPTADVPREAVPAQPPRRVWSGIEKLFAWLMLLFGYGFWCAFPMSGKPLGATLLLLALYVLSFVVLLRNRVRFDLPQKLVLLSAGLSALSTVIWDNRFLAFVAFLYVLAAYAYLVCVGCGNGIEGGWSDFLFRDLGRALFVFPFVSYGSLFRALSIPRGRGLGRTLLKILLGLALAALPCMAVFALLSYDSEFGRIMLRLFDFDSEWLTENLLRLLFGVPVALYVFGLFASATAGRAVPTAEEASARVLRRKVLSLLSAYAAALPLLALYAVFFISQWGYYTAAFTGVLPQGLSYADYARDGFFQLCAVSFINFLVVLCLRGFVKSEKAAPVRLLCLAFALCTLVLIATAMSKLVLYIQAYGLTPDRVHAAWFMALLTLLFVVLLLGLYVRRVRTAPLCAAVAVAMFVCLALSGPNRWIARYNVDRYLDGSTAQVDLYALESLGDDAIPELLRLEEAFREENGGQRPNVEGSYWYNYEDGSYERLLVILRDRAAENKPFFRQNLSGLLAESALRQAGFCELP